jgi:hypothetical protein
MPESLWNADRAPWRMWDRPVLLLSVQTLLLRDAYAYIDPGTGSYLFQFLMAGLFAGMYALRLFRGRIRSFFTKLFPKWSKSKYGQEGR